MVIKKVNTEIFQREIPTYGSTPSLFDCDDNNRYVVKHSQLGNKYHQLINEFIAVQLAKNVNVNVPDFALVDLNVDLYPNDFIFSNGKPSGLGFGSQYIPGKLTTLNKIENLFILLKLNRNELIEDFIKICIFDVWLRNADRSVGNANLVLQEMGNIFRLFAIDHASILSESNYIDLHREENELPPVGETLIDKELFSQLYFKFGLFFDDIKQEFFESIKNVSENEIKNILNNIPDQWQIKEIEKNSIFNFINSRKYLVEDHFNTLLKEIGI